MLTNIRKPDLTVEPLPGHAAAYARRLAAMIPGPFAPTSPLSHGKYTIVIFYENSQTENKEYPTRLRYGFATLDPNGKTQVLNASDLAHAHEPATQADELLAKFEQDSLRVCEELDKGQKRIAKMDTFLKTRSSRAIDPTAKDLEPRPDETNDIFLEVSSAAEVDELFGALGQGRMVGQESSPALPVWMQSRSDDAPES
jgi:hypothetical protein